MEPHEGPRKHPERARQVRATEIISVYNTVETLNKHRSVFINYLQVLARAAGIKFQIQAPPEE